MPRTAKKTQPLKTLRLGFITATIWANQTEKGVFPNITFKRTYKDAEGYHDTSSFGRKDLPAIAALSQQAEEFIASQNPA